ncbi:MAG: hypothetical protein AAGB30_10705 [Pedobacter sp.]|nr:hypothetical protein [Pedobacter sp.]
MRNIILSLITIILPFALLQAINGATIGNGLVLIIFILAATILFLVMVRGISKRKKSLILPFPFFVLAVFIGYSLLDKQAQTNKEAAEQLARKVEEFKAKTGAYPKHLTALIPDYVDNLPSEWYLFLPHDFEYMQENAGQAYSLFLKSGTYRTHVWTCGMDEWQFMD